MTHIQHFKIPFNLQFQSYAHFGYWPLISGHKPNKYVKNGNVSHE